ncbi:MAG: hypothetical protein R2851_23115 [Caldilineaceae bacterium]
MLNRTRRFLDAMIHPNLPISPPTSADGLLPQDIHGGVHADLLGSGTVTFVLRAPQALREPGG